MMLQVKFKFGYEVMILFLNYVVLVNASIRNYNVVQNEDNCPKERPQREEEHLHDIPQVLKHSKHAQHTNSTQRAQRLQHPHRRKVT